MANKKVRTVLLSFVLLIASLMMCLFGNFEPMSAFAASNITVNGSYSDVLYDLNLSENFDADSYKVDQTDYSLNLIQIAESVDKELFVYVYQPCTSRGILATSINISTEIHGKDYTNYKLRFLNSKGVFYKYIVEDFVVSDDDTRNYDISSIFRAFKIDFDNDKDIDKDISEISYPVAKLYVVTGFGDTIQYTCSDTEVITITDKYVGFVRYPDGFQLIQYEDECDSHYVAFNTDKQIDKLFEVDVYYTRQLVTDGQLFGSSTDKGFGEIEELYASYTYKDVGSFSGSGIGAHKFTWDRIQTVENFLATEDREYMYNCGIFNVTTESKMTDEGIQDLKGKKWIFRFAETPYRELQVTPAKVIQRYTVADVTILRLKFETAGVVYDLGVVDNKMTSDGIPDNYVKTTFEFTTAFKTIVAILLFILLVIILWPVLPYVFQFIGWLIKGIWKIITFPFTAIKSAVDKNKQNDKEQPTKYKKTTGKKVGKKNATGKNKK